jgi:hypothetical protein
MYEDLLSKMLPQEPSLCSAEKSQLRCAFFTERTGLILFNAPQKPNPARAFLSKSLFLDI